MHQRASWGADMKSLSLAFCVAMTLAVATSARATVISNSPNLPVLGVGYHASVGAGCFPLAGVCVAPGTITPTSVVTNFFDADGQNILMNVSYTGLLTNLADVPIGPINPLGTMHEEILGRTSNTELGSWNTEILSLSLSGPVLGHTLTIVLDGAHASTGVTSVAFVGSTSEPKFRIDSFFDVFVDLTLDTNPPLHTTRGPIRATLGVPEPGTLALLGFGVVGSAFMRRRRLRSECAPAI